MRLVWIVGDIHGCLGALKALEKKLCAQSEKLGREPFVVSVGDLIDRGPDSRAVVEHFIRGTRAQTHTAVMGNHEMMMLRCLLDQRPDLLEEVGALPGHIEPFEVAAQERPKFAKMGSRREWFVFNRLMWVSQGGAETLESYGCEPMELDSWSFDPDHLRFIAGLPTFWEDAYSVVTHALATARDLEILRGDGDKREAAKNVMWSRRLPKDPPDPLRLHISGHSIQSRVKRSKRRRIVRIDLGAYERRRLAAYCPELDKAITVPTDINWRRGH